MPSDKVAASLPNKATGRRKAAAELYNALELALGHPPKSKEIRGNLKNLITLYFSGIDDLRTLALEQKQKAGSS